MSEQAEKYVLKHAEKLCQSPCYPIAVRGWNELCELGFADESTGQIINWDYPVIWIEENAIPVAVMVYQHVMWMNMFHIVLSFVIPSHRRRGLYRRMYGEVLERAITAGVSQVQGTMHRMNIRAIQAADHLGRKTEFVTVVQRI